MAAVGAVALTGCALLRPTSAPRLFTLEARFESAAAPAAPAPTLLVSAPGARPGFDGPRLVYTTRPYELQFFARNEWVNPPAQMLAPLLASALEHSGKFQVIQGASGVTPALRLDTEITALQQEFTSRPSRARFALRAQLVDVNGRRIVATGEFEAAEEATSDDPYGGVVAANRAVARVLQEVAEWCGAQAP